MFFFDHDFLMKSALIFVRITALLFALPFFGDHVVPVRVRILCSVALSIGIYPLIPVGWMTFTGFDILPLAWMILKEAFIGLVIGYLGKLIFEGLVMAANLVGYQMGFGTANLLLPGSDLQINAFTALHRILILVFFLSLSLHYIFINGIVQTFLIIPAGSPVIKPEIGDILFSKSSEIFSTAVQLGAPILVALLFTMAALGLMARTVPQMNVFTLSFPLSFFVGLGVYLTMTPFLPGWLRDFYQKQGLSLWNSIYGLAP